ncbi:hypothetical protein F2P81_008031 [Scophthalmus maximus]|uniref:Uncharacterized protein n=1 Tax=Scophthalmus maximus TaxID=52904 RepID=A0A6A4SX59_SCOMX|nr:hypothetical protein F2P81_008031 [Scophthalmus maximus]
MTSARRFPSWRRKASSCVGITGCRRRILHSRVQLQNRIDCSLSGTKDLSLYNNHAHRHCLHLGRTLNVTSY